MKHNRYKPEPNAPKRESALEVVSKKYSRNLFFTLGFTVMMSLMSIWVYDAVTQSPFFVIKQVDISGNQRVGKNEVIQLAGVTDQTNLFQINLKTIEQQICCHPWIAGASVKRSLFSTLVVTLVEHEPLAIVNIENLTDLIINTQGHPFKEYDPQKDQLNFLPVISGMDLTRTGDAYQFEGPLFNAIMEVLKIKDFGRINTIMGDENIGVTIETQDIYNKNPTHIQATLPIQLGFSRFKEKQIKAIKISAYIDKNFPDKAISAMDLCDIEKVFITTKEIDALLHNSEKGV